MIPIYAEVPQEPVTTEQVQEMEQEIDIMLAELVKTLESAESDNLND